MGLLKHLLFWPVTGPSFLTRFSIGKVNDVVREELTDDSPVKEALLELQLQLESGEIDEEEYVEQENALMQQLREVRRWREEFGMGVSGGPVRIADAEPERDEVVDDRERPDTSQGQTDEAQQSAAEPPVYGGPGARTSADISVDFDDD